jgi:uncharacterized membrane protein YfcA
VLLLLKPFLVNFMGPLPDFAKIIVFLIAGVFTGFLSGMMGVGGGTIMVPVGGIGAFTHWKLGNVEAGILYGLIPGILLGTYLGGDLANIIPDNTLRLIFAVIIISLGFRYFKTSSPE